LYLLDTDPFVELPADKSPPGGQPYSAALKKRQAQTNVERDAPRQKLRARRLRFRNGILDVTIAPSSLLHTRRLPTLQ
jgi:hypothetical protein